MWRGRLAPPRGANTAPNFGHPALRSGGLRGLRFAYPHADKRRGLPRRCLRHRGRGLCGCSVAPCGREYRLIRARRWPPCGWVRRAPRRGLVGVRRLRETLSPKHGARVARGRDWAACGCAARYSYPVRVQRPRPFFLVGMKEGAAAGRPGRSGEGFALPGSGVQPLPWSRHRRRAGRRYSAGPGRSAWPNGFDACHRNIVRS